MRVAKVAFQSAVIGPTWPRSAAKVANREVPQRDSPDRSVRPTGR